jgi:hypothetical protein
MVLSACRFFQAEATLNISVVNAAGEPLADAQILVQKELRGRTNAQGHFLDTLRLPLDTPILIEVSKPSATIFYAPFFETIKLKRSETNLFRLQATLYGVPKVKTSESSRPVTPVQPQGEPPAPQPEEAVTTTSPEPAPTGEAGVEQAPPPDPSIDTLAAATEQALTTLNESEQSSRLMTFYVNSGSDHVGDASILFGDSARGQWLEGCTTNARGRCSLSLPAHLGDESIPVLVRAPGYQSQTRTFSFNQGDRMTIQLDRGHSLEVFAVKRQYLAVQGLKDVVVRIQKKELGRTDAFGYFTAPVPASSFAGETFTITLEAPSYLPSLVSSDFPAGGPITLIQNFQALEPPRLRVLMLPVQINGPGGRPQGLLWEKALEQGLKRELLGVEPFTPADEERVLSHLSKKGLHLRQLARNGWQDPELLMEFEYVLKPYLILGEQARLEINFIDARGQLQAAAQSRLPQQADPKTLTPILRRLAQETVGRLSFQGAIVESDKDGFRINLGRQHMRNLQVGEKISIHGLQGDTLGRKRTWSEIAEGQVIAVQDRQAQIRIGDVKPRSTVAVGDMIHLRRDPSDLTSAGSVLTVKDRSDRRPLAQANIYARGRWLGSTDAQGQVQVKTEDLRNAGEFLIIKVGYRPFSDVLPAATRNGLNWTLQRDALLVRLDSEPAQSLVKINGRVLGRTPLYQSVELPDGPILLEVSAGDEYRPWQETLRFSEDGIDYTGDRILVLEKNLRRQARQLLEQDRTQEALDLLDSLPPEHSEYLLAQHERGEIYLNRLQDPVTAAAVFHRVTSRPEVASYSDKRFIGTHINESVALYHAGEKQAGAEPQVALSYWQKAVEILDRTEGQLRFVPQDQYQQALHSLFYYRALSLHRRWALSQNPADLQLAHNAWKSYIQNTALTTPADRNYALLKRAETFFKQTQALMQGPAPRTSTQAM